MINLNVKINASEKSYPIRINNNDIPELYNEVLDITGKNNLLAVISEKVFKLYGNFLNLPKERVFVLKDGEKEKNFKTYQKILTAALKVKLTRNDFIIAVGGGVCGDIAGFAAATYMRGIHLIQIPTTLLACVDSSVGGKTGIDTDFGKNLVGAFYQPDAVLINTNFIKTLDEKQMKTGLGEVVKYAFIENSCKCDEEFNLINFLSLNSEKILSRDNKTLEELIKICISLKKSVVEKDEKEGGLRKILNFGHTYAHAVEKLTKYKKYTHGEAVVKGIEFVFSLALKMGIIVESYKFIAEDLIKKYNFKKIPDFDIRKIVAEMKLDKKATAENIVLILPTDCAVVKEYQMFDNEILKYFDQN